MLDMVKQCDPSTLICRTVVKLTTSAWKDKRGVNVKKSLTILKRKSGGDPWFLYDCDAVGMIETFEMFTNLYSVDDGVYEIVTTNEHRDWESGTIDDYDYTLIPFTE